ncbi:MAG: hypothetical protein AAGL89_06285 [Pseudomonadota bacterium]
MPATYKILSEPDLVYIRFSGDLAIDEISESLSTFAEDSSYREGMSHYFDLSDLTSYEQDQTKIMAWQAQVADVYPIGGKEHLMVFCAPEGPALDLATQIRKSWDGGHHPIVLRVFTDQQQALKVLGLTHPTLQALLS